MDEKLIDVAVNWWADKVSHNYHHDNGATDTANVLACFMADMLFKPVTEDQINIFKSELREFIKMGLKMEHGNVWIDTDYAPCLILSESAKKAGISCDNFPFKTSMVIEKGKVKVSDGYCKPFVEIGEREVE